MIVWSFTSIVKPRFGVVSRPEFGQDREGSVPLVFCAPLSVPEVERRQIVLQKGLPGFQSATAGDASYKIERVNRLPIPSDLLTGLT